MSKKLPSTPRGRKRLLKLCDLLEENADNKKGAKFDFGVWGFTEDETPKMNCNTTACALGMAAISGEFKDLSVDRNSDRYPDHIRILYKGETDDEIDIARKVFDLNQADASLLFTGMDLKNETGAKGEREWAKRVRKFVKEGKRPPSVSDW